MNPDEFKDAMNVAQTARAEARVELAAAALGTSPGKLADLDGAFWDRLGPDMRRRLLAELGAGSILASPNNTPVVAVARHGRLPWMLLLAVIFLKKMPAAAKGLLAALLVSMISTALALVHFSEASEPYVAGDGAHYCHRMTDAATCLYQIRHPMSWDEAATRAHIPVEQLRADNPNRESFGLVEGTWILLKRSTSTQP